MFEMGIFSELTELCKQLSTPDNGQPLYKTTELYDTTEKSKEDLYKIDINGEKVDILTPEGHKKFNDFVRSLRLDDNLSIFSDVFNSALDDTIDFVNKKYDEHQKELEEKVTQCECENCHRCINDDIALDITDDTKSNFDKIITSYFEKYPHKLNFDNDIEEESLRNRLRHFLGYVYNV